MRLPADSLEIVRAGAAALRELAAQLRRQAAVQPEAPELWLAVRDYEGLAGRLADPDDSDDLVESEWRGGFAGTFLSGQDLGVLDELLARRDDSAITVSEEQAAAVARLRRFLCQYIDRAFGSTNGHTASPTRADD